MGHEDLEQALRETLARRVAAPRAPAVDPAGPAIHRADRMQRRRNLAGVALAAIATVVVSAGMVQFGQRAERPGPTLVLGDTFGPPPAVATPSTAATGATLPTTMVVDGDLLSEDGRRVDLGGIGRVERAVPSGKEGWLLLSAPTAAGRTLWWVRRDGVPRVLLAGADAVTVAPDGRRVAWRDGREITVAEVVDGQMFPAVRRTAAARAEPVGFVGSDVLVRLHPDRPGIALLQPGDAALPARAGNSIANVYGRRPDGLLVARMGADGAIGYCLALVESSSELVPVQTGCTVDLSDDGRGSVSPDGRFLLVNGRESSRETALLFDLERGLAVPALWPVGPPVVGAPIWSGPDVVYPAADGVLVRFRVDAPGESATRTRMTQPGNGGPVLVTPGSI